MSEAELTRVPDFCIWNEYGSIFFKGSTDLTYVNLDEVV